MKLLYLTDTHIRGTSPKNRLDDYYESLKEKLKEITPRDIAQALCKAALEGGGRDNITVIVVLIKRQEEQKLPQTSWKNAWERIWKKGAKKL